MKPPSVAALAWRQTRRDLRAGELHMLALAVLLAVTALTAVGFLAARLNGGLAQDARQLLGGDAIVRSDHPLPPAVAQRAGAMGLGLARNVVFASMARAPDELGGAARLVSVKAVGEGYPLLGAMQLRSGPAAPVRSVAAAPAAGTVWVDAAVLDALRIGVGDALWLGDAKLRVGQIVVIEPDRGGGFVNFAPRVMMALADLPATGLVQPASRVRYRLAVAGGDAEVAEFVAATEAQIERESLRGVRIESLQSGQLPVQQTLDRGAAFLSLVALLAALLAAVAVAIAARDFAQSHLDDCAMLRVLGLAQRRIAGAYALEFAFVGGIASLAGVLLGLVVHAWLLALLAGLIEVQLPPPPLWPAWFGLGVGLTLLLGFGLPPVLQLARVPPLRVIRRDTAGPRGGSLTALLAGVGGFAALLFAAARDPVLGSIAVGGFAAAVAAFAGLAWLAVRVLGRFVPHSRAPRWLVLATRQIAARPAFAVLQVSALAVGLLALVLLVLLRTDLIASWRSASPADAPNRFVINIQPDQRDSFRAMLAREGVQRYDWYPMIRGRLTAIEGRPVTASQFEGERAQRLAEREFNLSHDDTLPPGNEVVAGRWQAGERDALSIDEGLATELGIALGERLTFDVAGIAVSGRVSSLRKIDWGTMHVNFFVMFPRAEIDELPLTYISAFKAPARDGFDRRLARDFPNVTAIDVSATIAQVQQVLDQVIRAVEFLFGFTLAAGLVVLFAAVSATREERAREFAIMRALGASSRLLVQVQRAELLGVGALAGLLASLAAVAVGWALARWVFEFEWTASAWVPLAGAVAGALLALAAGWWGLRDVLRRPVVETLRRAAE